MRRTLKDFRWMCLSAIVLLLLLSIKVDLLAITSCPTHSTMITPTELENTTKIDEPTTETQVQPPKETTPPPPQEDQEIPLQRTFGVPASTLRDFVLHIVPSNDNPPFYLVTQGDRFPEANGDRSQHTIIDRIGLLEKCKQDNSTIVVDIGGFLGDFGLRAAAMGCKAYIFEPTPFQYWLIKASIAINGFENRCFAYNYAISDKEEILKFKDWGGQTTQTPILPTDDIHNPELNTYFIHSISLDKILPTEKIFLMKVDVEGFEPNVLFGGCKNILEQRRVEHLITEYTPWWNENGQGPWDNFLPKLRDLGGKNATMYALDRVSSAVYGPIDDLKIFFENHVGGLQTDVYVDQTGTFKSDGLWVPGTLAK